jgi:SPP1 family predicted phage head-tail adaptor
MIGKMKDRVTAKKLQKISNGRGGWTHQEIDIGEFWAEIEALSARNIVQYRQGDLNTNTQIIMRSNDQINRECIFYARGQVYRIEEVLEDKGFLTILAVGENIGRE